MLKRLSTTHAATTFFPRCHYDSLSFKLALYCVALQGLQSLQGKAFSQSVRLLASSCRKHVVLFRLHREMHRALSLLPRNKKNALYCVALQGLQSLQGKAFSQSVRLRATSCRKHVALQMRVRLFLLLHFPFQGFLPWWPLPRDSSEGPDHQC